jgi:hypothetical protein
MWCCVDHALTDASEERIVSIFRVEKSANEKPAWAGGCRLSHQSETTTLVLGQTDDSWQTCKKTVLHFGVHNAYKQNKGFKIFFKFNIFINLI